MPTAPHQTTLSPLLAWLGLLLELSLLSPKQRGEPLAFSPEGGSITSEPALPSGVRCGKLSLGASP